MHRSRLQCNVILIDYVDSGLTLVFSFTLVFPGRGVFTSEDIEKSSFVVEYRGQMSALKQSRMKRSDCLNDYLFDFSWGGTHWR